MAQEGTEREVEAYVWPLRAWQTTPKRIGRSGRHYEVDRKFWEKVLNFVHSWCNISLSEWMVLTLT